jgi:hypothetical protein
MGGAGAGRESDSYTDVNGLGKVEAFTNPKLDVP